MRIMRPHALLATLALLLGGCDRADPPEENGGAVEGGTAQDRGSAQAAALRWDLQSSGEGTALALMAGSGATVVRLFCPLAKRVLLVNVPAFRAVGSEERLSFGSGGEVTALVADSRGDAQRGGVSATGPVPDNLAALIGGPVSINYGAQNSGPHPAPPAQPAREFAAACSEAPPSGPGPAPGESPPVDSAAAAACRMQHGKALEPNLIKAVGTEPFWAARIDGRCVTYRTPDDQKGTRIWTQFIGSRKQGVWIGFYADKRFVLRTRLEPGCSDGMSDRRYPLAVSLTVAGEQRSGCAELL